MSDLAPLAEAVAVDPLVDHPADFHVFHQFIERCKDLPALCTAVVWPLSEVALKGAVEAALEGLIEPTLIGDEAAMKALAAKINVDIGKYSILQADNESKAADLGVAMCRAGNAQAMMKGSLHTDVLMKAAMHRDLGLRTSRRISHVFIMDTPAYARTLLITDAAINITPELEDKIHIVQNAIDLAHALGIPEPKVALLSAVETVNPKIKSTLDAAALCKMADRGQITGGFSMAPGFRYGGKREGSADQKAGFAGHGSGRHSCGARPGERQHAGQAARVPGRRATGRHCARCARADHSDQPGGFGGDTADELRGCGPAALCRAPANQGLTPESKTLGLRNWNVPTGLPALIFDLDGTLTDSMPGIVGCLRKVLDARNMGDCGRPERFVGPPVDEWTAELLPLVAKRNAPNWLARIAPATTRKAGATIPCFPVSCRC